jgi:hypothetical protein
MGLPLDTTPSDSARERSPKRDRVLVQELELRYNACESHVVTVTT